MVVNTRTLQHVLIISSHITTSSMPNTHCLTGRAVLPAIVLEDVKHKLPLLLLISFCLTSQFVSKLLQVRPRRQEPHVGLQRRVFGDSW